MPDTGANSQKAVTTAVVMFAAIAGVGWMVWQAQNARVSALEDSQTSKTETLERLTNQRLALMEERLVEAHDNVEASRATAVKLAFMEERLAEAHKHAGLDAHPVAAEKYEALKSQIEAVRQMLQAQIDVGTRERDEDNKRELVDAGNDDRVLEMLNEVETQLRNLFRFVQLLWQDQRGEPLPNNTSRG